MRFVDLTGMKFGHLTVLQRSENGKGGMTRFLCRCDCGKLVTVMSKHIKSGAIDNCGCLSADRRMETKLKRGAAHGESETRLYRIWCGMKCRCYNKNRSRYADYGGRGITVCDEWRESFPAFRDWALSNGYADDLSIDRVNDDAGYSPENCRWATVVEQNNNRRKRRWKKRPIQPEMTTSRGKDECEQHGTA